MRELTMETLVRRLDGLERENRCLKWTGVVVLALLAAVVLMGQATTGKVAKVIEAEKLVLRDSTGAVRAVLGEEKSFGYCLTLYDENEKGRIFLGSAREHYYLSFRRANGELAADLEVDGGSSLRLWDRNGTNRVHLAVWYQGLPMIHINNKDGKDIWRAP